MSFKRIFSVITAWVLCSGSGLAQDLPDGAGKETVAAACSGCHNINVIRGGYSPEGWRTVIRMMQNVGAPVPQDQWDMTYSIRMVRQLLGGRMYPLTLAGLDQAMRELVR